MKIDIKQRKFILKRSLAGETQSEIAERYGVRQSRISQIIKEEKAKEKNVKLTFDSRDAWVNIRPSLSEWTTKQLINRYGVVVSDIRAIEQEQHLRAERIQSLEKEIRRTPRDPAKVLELRAEITRWKRQDHLASQLQDVHEEAADIIAELRVREVRLPLVKR